MTEKSAIPITRNPVPANTEAAIRAAVRTAKLLDHLGFRRMGEVTSYRDDGTSRPSLAWEVTRAEWMRRTPIGEPGQ